MEDVKELSMTKSRIIDDLQKKSQYISSMSIAGAEIDETVSKNMKRSYFEPEENDDNAEQRYKYNEGFQRYPTNSSPSRNWNSLNDSSTSIGQVSPKKSQQSNLKINKAFPDPLIFNEAYETTQNIMKSTHEKKEPYNITNNSRKVSSYMSKLQDYLEVSNACKYI